MEKGWQGVCTKAADLGGGLWNGPQEEETMVWVWEEMKVFEEFLMRCGSFNIVGFTL